MEMPKKYYVMDKMHIKSAKNLDKICSYTILYKRQYNINGYFCIVFFKYWREKDKKMYNNILIKASKLYKITI